VVSKSGHLNSQTGDPSPIWLFFFLFSLVYEKKWIGFSLGVCTWMLAYLNYKNDNSYPSMWCWFANSSMIYYAIYLLMYLPFLDKMAIC
jgi:hypothetical protein